MFAFIPQKYKEVLRLAWPLIIANAFWNIQLTVDRIFIGEYSSLGLGAVIAAGIVFWVPMALLQQTSAYVSTFIAQYSGSKQPEMIGTAFWQAIWIALIGGSLFLLLLFPTPYLFSIFSHSQEMQALEVIYFKAICWSALPTAIVAVCSGFFTGIEKTATIMKINAAGMMANILFDYVLIFGHWGFPELGVKGAGYATSLAALVAMIYGLMVVIRADPTNLYKITSSIKLHTDVFRRFLIYGVPSGLQWSLEATAFTVFVVFIGRLPNGDASLTATSIALSIMHLSVLPSIGVAQAIGVLVGKSLGQSAPDKAETFSWAGVRIVAIYMLTMGISFILIPDFYINWFAPRVGTDVWLQAQHIAVFLLMFMALFTLFDSMNFVLSFALRGAGDTKFISWVSLLVPWPLMVIPTWMVSKHAQGIYYAWGFASFYIIVLAFIILFRFRGGKWKKMRVIEMQQTPSELDLNATASKTDLPDPVQFQL
ncbi:MAG: MATE family efflux transporter [Deltaproteobacteria bacterium]|nr:MATE family efflux transporter [Deltaproteobacteria bacterium]